MVPLRSPKRPSLPLKDSSTLTKFSPAGLPAKNCCCSLNERGTRGTLIFTSATAGIRGNVATSAFASGKFAQRALSQSLAKAYGKENIHV